MRTLRRVAVLSLGAVLLVGCGESSSHNDPMDARSFAAGYADAICSSLAKCSCTDASAVKDCKVAYNEMITAELAWALTSNPAQAIDPAAAEACLADVRAVLGTCSNPADGAGAAPASCQEIFVGTRAQDDPCSLDSDCVAGLVCDLNTSACAQPVPLDGNCDGSVSCAEGLYCPAGQCQPRPGEGEACPFGNCQEGLDCRWKAGAEEDQCQGRHPLDEDCSDGYGCAAGTYCDWNDTHTCLTLLPDGASCDYSYQCAHDWCNEFDGQCADPGICWVMGPK